MSSADVPHSQAIGSSNMRYSDPGLMVAVLRAYGAPVLAKRSHSYRNRPFGIKDGKIRTCDGLHLYRL